MPNPIALPRDRWLGLCARLTPTLDAAPAFTKLKQAYAEPHRAYHNAEHIVECLAHLDTLAPHAAAPDEIEWALWLHDAVYKTRGGDSEAESANWSTTLLKSGATPAESITRIEAMILATKHAEPAPFPDAALMVDIDLAILGADEPRYDRYESDVRKEYRWVPGPLFRAKRKGLLQTFLARPHIYETQPFQTTRDPKARENLTRAIEQL